MLFGGLAEDVHINVSSDDDIIVRDGNSLINVMFY